MTDLLDELRRRLPDAQPAGVAPWISAEARRTLDPDGRFNPGKAL